MEPVMAKAGFFLVDLAPNARHKLDAVAAIDELAESSIQILP